MMKKIITTQARKRTTTYNFGDMLKNELMKKAVGSEKQGILNNDKRVMCDMIKRSR